MNTKHYLAAILFFWIIFLLGFSVKSQEISDTIIIEKKIIGYEYYKDGFLLTFNQVAQLTKSNTESAKLMEKSIDMRISGYVWEGVGGFILGSSLGYALGCAMVDKFFSKPLFFGLLGAGTVVMSTGIGLEICAIKKAKKSVDIYNNSIKQKNNANLDLGISTQGMMLRLNF